MMMHDGPWVMILACGFSMLIFIAELWRKLGSPSAEATRKVVHIGSGFGCGMMPFVLNSAWSVFFLALVFVSVFAITRQMGLLPSLHGVQRKTQGSLYYPIAVLIVFILSSHTPAIYLASILVLALADGAAAMIGTHYGVHRYRCGPGVRSVEGSVAFCVVSYLAISTTLLLLTEIAPSHVCAVSLGVALVLTMVESMSFYGTDNLSVPVGASLLLGYFLP